MKKIVAFALMMMASVSFADPVSIRVKSGLLINQKDQMVEVDSGLFLNEDALTQVRGDFSKLTNQNTALITELKAANKEIENASSYIPGLPGWATIVISAVLTVATMTVGYFAVREVAK